MSRRLALTLILLGAIMSQASGLCQIRCADSANRAATTASHRGCHGLPSPEQSLQASHDRNCQHLFAATAILTSVPHVDVGASPVAHTFAVLRDATRTRVTADLVTSHTGPPISSAGTLRI